MNYSRKVAKRGGGGGGGGCRGQFSRSINTPFRNEDSLKSVKKSILIKLENE